MNNTKRSCARKDGRYTRHVLDAYPVIPVISPNILCIMLEYGTMAGPLAHDGALRELGRIWARGKIDFVPNGAI